MQLLYFATGVTLWLVSVALMIVMLPVMWLVNVAGVLLDSIHYWLFLVSNEGVAMTKAGLAGNDDDQFNRLG